MPVPRAARVPQAVLFQTEETKAGWESIKSNMSELGGCAHVVMMESQFRGTLLIFTAVTAKPPGFSFG